ncbi:TraB family protein, partial [Candidatus Woesearchaeota archaeon]|nr:TraB family protein [Candidatus Woesearchaeota archaeon]
MKNIEIIGSSHIAKESIQTIKNKIFEQKPKIIAVELDASRVPYLFAQQQRKLRFSDMKRLGFMGFMFSLIGGFVQRKLGEKVGLAPGADIRTAIKAAGKIKARVYLIDRPIEQTLQRLSR